MDVYSCTGNTWVDCTQLIMHRADKLATRPTNPIVTYSPQRNTSKWLKLNAGKIVAVTHN